MSKISDIIDKQFYGSVEGNVYAEIINKIETLVIEKALEQSEGNQLSASKKLGINRNTLRKKIRQFHIDVRRFKR
ncbi:MAG: helix-turn-helix domain-containing protein [Candidatus Orphnella occulta]|nr:helix-turn-helix domain-containing protein [Candidatus Orphnella occulta]